MLNENDLNAVMKCYILLFFSCFLMLPALAQNSKRVRDLKNQKARLQQTLKRSKQDLERTRSDVNKGKKTIQVLDQQIHTRVQYIQRTQSELDSLNYSIDTLKTRIRCLDSVLLVKKAKFKKSLRLAQAYRKVNSSLLFAMSADNVTQMYRRLRYTREYAAYQRAQGENVVRQQVIVLEHQNRMLALKSEANQKMQTLISERAKLARQQADEQSNVNRLQKKQNSLQQQVDLQNKQIAALEKKIDQLVAYEIEQARKRAEAEARRKAEAARRKAEQQRKAAVKSVPEGRETATQPLKETSRSIAKGQWLTPEEKQLNGGFEQNRGRLPVPITGPYMVGAHYGANTMGKRNIMLQNKGVNYVGQAGARARVVFDGEVSAVFALSGMKNILVRHGSYISVYCNLSSVIVKKGQRVKARDLLGTVAADFTGDYVLHFQLRKETTRLNPEQWVGR